MIRCGAGLALLAAGPLILSAADRWRVSFSYDKPEENFDIADFRCPAAGRCLAVGALEKANKFTPYAVTTADAGAHWNRLKIPEVPLSLFFLNADTGWMVAEKGVLQTHDGGGTWKEVSSERDLQRVFFLNENHGFAVGDKRRLLATANGGAKWTEVRSLQGLTGPPDEITFEWIFFADPRTGIVIGEQAPAGVRPVPAWLEPERRRGRASRISVLLGRTSDGGASWAFSSIRRSDDLVSVSLHSRELWFVFQPSGNEKESEIARCDWESDSLIPLADDSDELIADAARVGDTNYVAAIARQGRLMEVPIPGKMRVFAGLNFDHLAPMDVDYRAVALRAHFAVGPNGNAFLATDTGMILKLAHQP